MAHEKPGLASAAMKILPAFLGKLGIIESPFAAVRASIIIGMIASVTFIAIVTAKITSVLVESTKGGSMVKRVDFSCHAIICGWNFQGERIISELLKFDVREQRGIVIVYDPE